MHGKVIGWAVKSFEDLGPNGQLRPVAKLEAAVERVLDLPAIGRSSGQLRARLLGHGPEVLMGEEQMRRCTWLTQS